MSKLLGFEIDFWDYATFLALFVCVALFLVFIVWLAGLPGRIAIARKHPDAEAVKIMGYAGFAAAVPWLQAFIWAFKPTNIVDVRRFPKAEAEAIDEEIARLSGHPLPPAATPGAVKTKIPPPAQPGTGVPPPPPPPGGSDPR